MDFKIGKSFKGKSFSFFYNDLHQAVPTELCNNFPFQRIIQYRPKSKFLIYSTQAAVLRYIHYL